MSKTRSRAKKTIRWGWYVCASVAAVCASAVTGFVMSFGTLHGQIVKGGTPSHHLCQNMISVYVLDEKDGREFLKKVQSEIDDEKQALLAEFKDACARADLPSPDPAPQKPASGLATALRITMDVATMGLFELTQNNGGSGGSNRSQLRYEIEKTQWRYNTFPVAGFVFDRIPRSKAISTALTDDSGKFQFLLPKGKRFLLIADAPFMGVVPLSQSEWQHLFHPPTQRGYWMLWTSLNGKGDEYVTLSPDNMTDSSVKQNALSCACYQWQDK